MKKLNKYLLIFVMLPFLSASLNSNDIKTFQPTNEVVLLSTQYEYINTAVEVYRGKGGRISDHVIALIESRDGMADIFVLESNNSIFRTGSAFEVSFDHEGNVLRAGMTR